jgi:hypothetical protein
MRAAKRLGSAETAIVKACEAAEGNSSNCLTGHRIHSEAHRITFKSGRRSAVLVSSHAGTSGEEARQGAEVIRPRAVTTTH